MKQLFTSLILCVSIFFSGIAGADNLWQQVAPAQAPKNLQVMHPTAYLVYTVDEATLKLQMWNLQNNLAAAIIITLPQPDGSFRDFKVWQTPMMPDQLAAKYPDIKTFTATALDDRTVTAKLDFTPYGFHAMIYDGENISFIDPYDNAHDGYYMVHYKKNETRAFNDRMKCLVQGHSASPGGDGFYMEQKNSPRLANKVMNGYQLRTYRLALSADNFYCQASTGLASPTIAQSLSKMTTSMNRINGVYEREFSITMAFVAHEDTLIWPTATGSINGADPFNTIDANANACLTQNQTECDTRIGDANYDIGHVFTTGAGGLSDLGCVCQSGAKAQSATGGPSPVGDGFDIDYVAHEMGHEYGANHPFNNGVDGSCCCGNINTPTAYEPGSGSTIMAYAGICSPDDLQYHSDAYFHSISLQEITTYSTNGGPGDACPVKSPTSNKFVGYTSFAATYSIPYLTPFELAAPIVKDSVSDSTILYCWEEWDLGGTGLELVNTHAAGPIFRSYDPVTSNIRVFPKVSMVLSGVLSNAGTEGAEGEKVPDVARSLNFKCTFRDIIHNLGCITLPDDEITLNAINTGAGFAVTSQNTAGLAYNGGSTQLVTWNVVSTNTAPINAANVDIYMSIDGGNTWGYHVGNFPNSGTANVTLPNPPSTMSLVRLKVKGSGNVFFNVNSKDFTVYYNSSLPVTPTGVPLVNTLANDIKIFPVPATDILRITTGNTTLHGIVYNTIGQVIWQDQINGQTDIPVSSWAKGVYYMRFADTSNGNVTVKSFVIR
jgi:hypothetical protein